MAVKTYQKGADTKLSANFRIREFDCNGKGCCNETKIDPQLVDYLQKIRDHFGKSVNIASGYRCQKHNAQVANAAKNSRHMQGMAADIKVSGIAPAAVAGYAESIGVRGIGLYEGADGNFVHIDTRADKFYWYGHAQSPRQTFGGKPVAATLQIALPALQKGDKGVSVKALQRLLGIAVDGSFGPATQSAVKTRQKSAGLQQTGICDAATWKALLGVAS